MRAPFVLIAALAFAPVAHAKLYKWVDENGVTQYGDAIPPQYAGQASSELNRKGVVVRKTDAALTADQIKAKEADEARRKEDEQKARDRKRRDEALLNTYTSPKEIELTRDRNLEQAELQLKGAEVRLKNAEDKLRGYENQAKGRNPVPAVLQQEIKESQAERDKARGLVDQRKADMEAIRVRFEEDKQRYIELTASRRK